MTEILPEQPETSTTNQNQRNNSLLEQVIAENLAFRRALDKNQRYLQAVQQQCDRLVEIVERQTIEKNEAVRSAEELREHDDSLVDTLVEQFYVESNEKIQLKKENKKLRKQIAVLKTKKTITKAPFPRRIFSFKK